jgi:hypothetical protein
MTGNADDLGPRFIRQYSELMSGVWVSDDELAKLQSNPTQYAIDKGLPVEPGARVVLDRSQPADGLFQRQQIIADWTATKGTHILHVPATPLVDPSELSESELDAVAAGNNNNNVIALIL